MACIQEKINKPLLLRALPTILTEPMIYLSEMQIRLCKKHPSLLMYVSLLPGWVPHRILSVALGYDTCSIDSAMNYLGNKPYVWATELENVHSFWLFDEPSITLRQNGKLEYYKDSEALYHSFKPKPFDKELWMVQRVSAMRFAIREKFNRSWKACAVLRSTYPHQLLSIKNDSTWGFHPQLGGQNLLAILLMELRHDIVALDMLPYHILLKHDHEK